MKNFIKSVLLGAIIPLLFFIVGQSGKLKDNTKIDYIVALGFVLVIWILCTIAIFILIYSDKNKQNKSG